MLNILSKQKKTVAKRKKIPIRQIKLIETHHHLSTPIPSSSEDALEIRDQMLDTCSSQVMKIDKSNEQFQQLNIDLEKLHEKVMSAKVEQAEKQLVQTKSVISDIIHKKNIRTVWETEIRKELSNLESCFQSSVEKKNGVTTAISERKSNANSLNDIFLERQYNVAEAAEDLILKINDLQRKVEDVNKQTRYISKLRYEKRKAIAEDLEMSQHFLVEKLQQIPLDICNEEKGMAENAKGCEYVEIERGKLELTRPDSDIAPTVVNTNDYGIDKMTDDIFAIMVNEVLNEILPKQGKSDSANDLFKVFEKSGIFNSNLQKCIMDISGISYVKSFGDNSAIIEIIKNWLKHCDDIKMDRIIFEHVTMEEHIWHVKDADLCYISNIISDFIWNDCLTDTIEKIQI